MLYYNYSKEPLQNPILIVKAPTLLDFLSLLGRGGGLGCGRAWAAPFLSVSRFEGGGGCYGSLRILWVFTTEVSSLYEGLKKVWILDVA